MSNEHIKINIQPDIITKAGPGVEKIDAKAVAGVSADDIIERNVIAKLEDEEEDRDTINEPTDL